MGKGVKHYFRDGKSHGKTSKRLFHFKDLSKTAQAKAKKNR